MNTRNRNPGLPARPAPPERGLPFSKPARKRYHWDHFLNEVNGRAPFTDPAVVRRLVQKMNSRRDPAAYPEQALRTGQLAGMGLIDEILRHVWGLYRREHPQVTADALHNLDQSLGPPAVQSVLQEFVAGFPPASVYRGEQTGAEYLRGTSSGIPNREIVLEELLLLHLANDNPAFLPGKELFDDQYLSDPASYARVLENLSHFLESQPRFSRRNQPIIALLRSPVRAAPHSLAGQLEYIRANWADLLDGFLDLLLKTLDLVREETKTGFTGPGPPEIPEYAGQAAQAVQFSPDRDWMPNLVLIAKNTYVWLEQLRRSYGREITRLDQIPEEELTLLRNRGINGLWLIGIWERSPASQKIKRACGNPEAVASAYSLWDYELARDLGGEAAFQVLRQRAQARGIHLAADMVPNHTGISSRWVNEHPDWYIARDTSPFPSYSFTGPDLSDDPRVGIFIEDKYYSRRDAAVVFKQVDPKTGTARYLYHGNDGTALPWNDTAQLNYLNPEVREAVIQTILGLARKFSIIRFDAAMTLTRKHFQRLWFPEPGSGGAIPSRSEQGLSRPEFEAAMPREFWREVVDRVAAEAPDTLLLAEAFWLMEGYFVRTLGMHRVYNSAFMNMLRDEKNAEYRQLLRNTLEFDPRILKRYVNFMNNPDEEPAAVQFGREDKYFGICTLMATLPGLPMFGHGQIEGYREKYGMEYKRPYWDEHPDEHLLRRHEQEIFPLLHKRYLFSGVENFRLYEFSLAGGASDPNVFAFSNRRDDEFGLIVYHNRYAETAGWIHTAVPFTALPQGEESPSPGRDSLAAALGCAGNLSGYVLFRDQRTGLEYIRHAPELARRGLFVRLGAYQTQVFLEFRQVQDTAEMPYSRLHDFLDGNGVPSIPETLQEFRFQPVVKAFNKLLQPELGRRVLEARSATDIEPVLEEFSAFLTAGVTASGEEGHRAPLRAEFKRRLLALTGLTGATQAAPRNRSGRAGREFLPQVFSEPTPESLVILMGWLGVHLLGKIRAGTADPVLSRTLIDAWRLGRTLQTRLLDLGADARSAERAVLLVKILTTHQDWIELCSGGEAPAARLVQHWLGDEDIRRFLQINHYQGVWWYNRETCENLLDWLIIPVVLRPAPAAGTSEVMLGIRVLRQLRRALEPSRYQVEKLLNQIRSEPAA